tara:strand:+ start:464 stop:730 length:267 start_codon:yes stop_codon:yes gene_type:complete
MKLKEASSLCYEILGDIDNIRFEIHDIQIALATKELKSGEAKDLEFGIDLTNKLMVESGAVTQKMQTLSKLLTAGLKVKEKKKREEPE